MATRSSLRTRRSRRLRTLRPRGQEDKDSDFIYTSPVRRRFYELDFTRSEASTRKKRRRVAGSTGTNTVRSKHVDFSSKKKLRQLTCKQLRGYLRDKGLDETGKKVKLVRRLFDAHRQPSEDANRFDDLVSAARSVPGVKPGHAARVAEAIASSSPAVVDRSAAGSTAELKDANNETSEVVVTNSTEVVPPSISERGFDHHGDFIGDNSDRHDEGAETKENESVDDNGKYRYSIGAELNRETKSSDVTALIGDMANDNGEGFADDGNQSVGSAEANADADTDVEDDATKFPEKAAPEAYRDEKETKTEVTTLDGDRLAHSVHANGSNVEDHVQQRRAEKAEADGNVEGFTDDGNQSIDSAEGNADADTDVEDDATKFPEKAEADGNVEGFTDDGNQSIDSAEGNADADTDVEDDATKFPEKAEADDNVEGFADDGNEAIDSAEGNADAESDVEDDATKFPEKAEADGNVEDFADDGNEAIDSAEGNTDAESDVEDDATKFSDDDSEGYDDFENVLTSGAALAGYDGDMYPGIVGRGTGQSAYADDEDNDDPGDADMFDDNSAGRNASPEYVDLVSSDESETGPVDTGPVDAAPVNAAPVDAAPGGDTTGDIAPSKASLSDTAPVDATSVDTAPGGDTTDGNAVISYEVESDATSGVDVAVQDVSPSKPNSSDTAVDVEADPDDQEQNPAHVQAITDGIQTRQDQRQDGAAPNDGTDGALSSSDIPKQDNVEGASATLETPEDSSVIKTTSPVQDPGVHTGTSSLAENEVLAVKGLAETEVPANEIETEQKSPAEKQFLRILQQNLHSELQSEIDRPGSLSTTPTEREAYLQTITSNKRERPPDFEQDGPDESTRRKIRFTPYAPAPDSSSTNGLKPDFSADNHGTSIPFNEATDRTPVPSHSQFRPRDPLYTTAQSPLHYRWIANQQQQSAAQPSVVKSHRVEVAPVGPKSPQGLCSAVTFASIFLDFFGALSLVATHGDLKDQLELFGHLFAVAAILKIIKLFWKNFPESSLPTVAEVFCCFFFVIYFLVHSKSLLWCLLVASAIDFGESFNSHTTALRKVGSGTVSIGLFVMDMQSRQSPVVSSEWSFYGPLSFCAGSFLLLLECYRSDAALQKLFTDAINDCRSTTD